LHINIKRASKEKLSINENKYPIKYCYGSICKYTEFSSITDITKTHGQSISENVYFDPTTDKENINYDYFHSQLPFIKQKALDFTKDQNWVSYDTPNNLVLALNSELAELCKIFQWMSDDKPAYNISNSQWNKAAQEITDVLIYTLKLDNTMTVQQTSHKIL
jgi:predicted nucleic-acid-binding Zn-ribbon protein/NTP pyrophosphatase (non-canonical NTP hydrolase)